MKDNTLQQCPYSSINIKCIMMSICKQQCQYVVDCKVDFGYQLLGDDRLIDRQAIRQRVKEKILQQNISEEEKQFLIARI